MQSKDYTHTPTYSATTENKISKEELLSLAAEAAKENCRKCYGRGVQNYLVGDGYIRTKIEGKVVKTPNAARKQLPCSCTKLHYAQVG